LSRKAQHSKGAACWTARIGAQTFCDRSLEREVLQLFDRQAELLIGRMRGIAPGRVATLAHTLKGSAMGIGAGRVARAAEDTELSANQAPAECDRAIDRLALAIDEVRVEIGVILAPRITGMAPPKNELYRSRRAIDAAIPVFLPHAEDHYTDSSAPPAQSTPNSVRP